MSIESEDPHSSETPRVYLGGMRMCADDANGLGCRTDGSRSQVDGPGGLTDAPSASNKAETDVISHGDGMNTYLGAGDTKRAIDAMDGVETHADVSTRQGEVPSVESDASSIETDTRMAVNVRRDVRKRQAEAQTQNSPKGPQIEPPKSTHRWKRVGVGDVNVYLPWNAPVEALGRTLALGEVESGGEAIALRDIEGERAGVGVRAATEECKTMTYLRRGRIKFVPIKVNTARKDETTYHGCTSTAQPPIINLKRAYRVIGLRRRRGRMKIEPARLKIEHLNDEKQQNGEITYPGRTEIAQPPTNDAKCLNKAVGPGPRHDRIKIKSVKVKIKRINDKIAQDDETTYLHHAQLTQPLVNASRRACGVVGPKRRRDLIKIRPVNVNQT
ncbi:hypothetical protein SCLCIDRAFT_21204 [Scleroderma citrinum Foug A]|uniref:Uncharacterized protein n=1 Tax=Scleroderma citrinum Foug A TaxID=1036808 RepID=A0A0C3EGB5_9AGAM|nr:hypothetical protein SCLCIDRAFT_21204 [Scleroderma citrinum Foug A]